MQVTRAHGLPVVNPIRLDGKFQDSVPIVGGMFFKDADPRLVQELSDRGLLYRSEPYEHSYPHCWRCHTLLIYYALPSWYIRTTAAKDQLLAENEKTNWYPPNIKHGRYGEWLRNNVDWALSRTRYWGTPLPLWECENEHITCVGSRAELAELAGQDLSSLDPHRPFVDEITFACPDCGDAGPPGPRRHRRLVRLGLDAVRPARRALAARGGLRAGVPGPVHLRGDRPDPRLVLLADGGQHAGVRPELLRERGLPRAGR